MGWTAYFIVREPVKKSPGLDLLVHGDFPIPPTTRACDNVLVERKRHERNHAHQVHDCANGAHSLWPGTIGPQLETHTHTLSLSFPLHGSTYSSRLSDLLISFPFNPTFLNASPSQLISANVPANAIPLNPKLATSGSPSPLKTV